MRKKIGPVVFQNSAAAFAFSMGFLAAVTTLSLTACGTKPATTPETESDSVATLANAEETTSAEVTIADEYTEVDPFADFKDTPESKYYLVLDGKEHDVTEYVLTADEGFCTYKSSILEDVFGFERVIGDDADVFVTYKKGEDVVKFEIGGPYVIVNENRYTTMDQISLIEGADEAAIPIDFIFGLGYDKYSTQREGDNLRIIVGSTLAEDLATVDESIPSEGETVAAETMSEDMPEAESSEETVEKSETPETEEEATDAETEEVE